MGITVADTEEGIRPVAVVVVEDIRPFAVVAAAVAAVEACIAAAVAEGAVAWTEIGHKGEEPWGSEIAVVEAFHCWSSWVPEKTNLRSQCNREGILEGFVYVAAAGVVVDIEEGSPVVAVVAAAAAEAAVGIEEKTFVNCCAASWEACEIEEEPVGSSWDSAFVLASVVLASCAAVAGVAFGSSWVASFAERASVAS